MRDHGRYQIGYVADQVGLSLRTVRYYEEVGLAKPSGRTEGGFRLYTDDDIGRLALIKQLNFTLDELRDLLDTRDRLARDDLQEQERAQLSGHLAGYVTLAEHRCDELRSQLAAVVDVTQQLRRQIKAHRRHPTRASGG